VSAQTEQESFSFQAVVVQILDLMVHSLSSDLPLNVSRELLTISPAPLVRRLNREPADPHLAEWAHVLFDQAVLTFGARIEEPAAFVGRLKRSPGQPGFCRRPGGFAAPEPDPGARSGLGALADVP